MIRFVCALIVAFPWSIAAQRMGTQQPILDSYAATVGRYRAGEIEVALQELIAHDRWWVDDALKALERSRWPTVDVEAAALLHIEAALRSRTGYLDQNLHLGTARRILDLDHGTRLPAEFQRRLDLLVAWYLHSALRFDDLARHLDLILKRFPNDAEVLLALGSFYEGVGWSSEPPINLAPSPIGRRATTDGRPRILRPIDGRNQRRIQEEAAATFRRALAAAPELDEARLRLGRVLNELGRPAEALQMLQPFHQRETEVRFKYLAALFEGAAQQRGDHLDAAVEAYRVATTIYPGCQTPWVALSGALRANGERSAAYGILLRVAESEPQSEDPWWGYKFGQSWRFDAVFAQMKHQVIR